MTKHIFPAIARHEPNFGMPFFKRIFHFLHLKIILITPVVHIIKSRRMKKNRKIYDVKKVLSEKIIYGSTYVP